MSILRVLCSAVALILKLLMFGYGAYWIGLFMLSAVLINERGIEPSSFMIYLGTFISFYGLLFMLPNRIILKNNWRPHIYWILMAVPAIVLPIYGGQRPFEARDELYNQMHELAVLGLGAPFAACIVSLIFAAISKRIRANLASRNSEEMKAQDSIALKNRKEPVFSGSTIDC